MELKTSFWGWLTSEGRLKNRWARALADPNPASSLNRLREVQQKLRENPAKFTHLWLPFLNTFLDASRVGVLTDADLTAAVEMGEALTEMEKVQAWFRVVQAYDARREERQARALLTRIYYVPTASREVKAWCARDLARRGAAGDEHLNIYMDHLQRVPNPNQEIQILHILASVCIVDFASDKIKLRRAGEVAQRLLASKIQLPGLQTTLGLRSLLVEQNSANAAKEFKAAYLANNNDRVALVGLFAAAMQNGTYNDVIGMAQHIPYTGHPSDAVVAGLVRLNATLYWLDSHMPTGPLLEDTQSLRGLKNLGLNRYVGDVVDLAIGRLSLLEGNAKEAAEVLMPLADRHPEQPRWGYYAAWAAAVVGDRAGVARRLAALAKWPHRWTVACLLLDSDPALAEKNKVYIHLEEMGISKNPLMQAYASTIKARVALARSNPPPKVEWRPGSDSITLEADMEALRTALGCALYTKDGAAMEQGMTLPLFRHLPLADQVMWRGLQALLAGDQVRGRTLLETASVRYGYRRAALALAVHFLEQNKISEAKRFLELAAAGRTDSKVTLLRAYIDACEGRSESASGQFEKLVTQGEARAHYALGNLYLQRAEEARRAGRFDHTRLYREQAAGAFGAALKKGKQSLPIDCEIVASCATLIAQPKQGLESHASIWYALERLDASRRQPWLIWHAALAQIWYGKPAEVTTACEEMLTLLEDGVRLEDSAAGVLAQEIAYACLKVEDIAQTDTLVDLLVHLSRQNQQATVKRFFRLGIAAASYLRYTKMGKAPRNREQRNKVQQQIARQAKVDSGNGSLALLHAYTYLEDHQVADAAAALRDVRPEDTFEQRLCASLADLLGGHVPSLETLPQAEQTAAAELVQACHLLRAASAFAADKPDQGYEAILVALRKQARETATIVNIGRFLPALCAHSTRGGTIPPYLVEAVRHMSRASGDSTQTATVARCAVAIGEIEVACRLWEQALAQDGNPESPLRREFANLLCYLAVEAHKSGKPLEAAQKFYQAAKQLS